MVQARAKAELTEQLFGACAGSMRIGAMNDVRQHDVLARVEVGQQMVELVDEAECIPADPRTPFVIETSRFLTELPSRTDPFEVLAIVFIALVLSFLATLYPAWKAASTDPVQVLRYE